ncbi:hypothetical protein Poli38472_008976 [Pythium oligandrum]|uniref:THO complex subunit 7 n=1 Tax=Pythium oligandrum TaxID=41045 RepID=A0A8K1CJN8_PYTOL|nr:hypothetical protein Poli38472_008976 [Pythium oligandrum]|eukprot:TMW64809.1 hypothetical protein Poli38472_008976 [Pythium oligandrum]
MADEELIIRRRLLTRTSVVGKAGLKKCAEGVLSLFDALAEDGIDELTCKQEVDALLWEMEQLEFEANKTDILGYTCERELEAYETLNADIDASILKVSEEIEELMAKVQVEKTIRAYKEEYESISRVINELPSRQDLAAELAVEEKRLSEAQIALSAVDEKLDLRTKQFSLLMSTIQNLKSTLDEDTAMDDEEDEQQKRSGDAEDEDMEDTSEKRGATQDDDDMNGGRSP